MIRKQHIGLNYYVMLVKLGFLLKHLHKLQNVLLKRLLAVFQAKISPLSSIQSVV